MNLNLQTEANRSASQSRHGESASRAVTLSPFHRFPRCRGLTLAELMVAVGVGSLLLTVVSMVFMTSARSFEAMGNYATMNRSSRNALDHMTREIRRAGSLTDFASTSTAARLQFLKYGTTNSFVIYRWDADSRQLTEWMTGNTTTNILLAECDELAFSMYKNSLAQTTDVTEGKAIGVSWKCSRTILGIKATTDPMQQAVIVIRNQQTL